MQESSHHPLMPETSAPSEGMYTQRLQSRGTIIQNVFCSGVLCRRLLLLGGGTCSDQVGYASASLDEPPVPLEPPKYPKEWPSSQNQGYTCSLMLGTLEVQAHFRMVCCLLGGLVLQSSVQTSTQAPSQGGCHTIQIGSPSKLHPDALPGVGCAGDLKVYTLRTR